MAGISAKDARRLLVVFGGWFGAPVLILGGKVLDGRVRLAEWRALHFPGKPPEHVSDTTEDAARFLAAVGHLSRASTLSPRIAAFMDEKTSDIADVARVPSSAILRSGKRHHPEKRRLYRRIHWLYLAAIEDGRPITADDLASALEVCS